MTANIVATLQGELRQRLVDLRGTPAFAEALAQRERAMGMSAAGATAAEADDDSNDGDTRAVLEDSMPPLTLLPLQGGHLDSWGNTILDGSGQYGRFGQYRVRSAWDGRILRVCGEAASGKHLALWSYDADERRMVCGVCWPERHASARIDETAATTAATVEDEDQ